MAVNVSGRKVWTVRLGTDLKSGRDFCSALEKNRFLIGKAARDMLKQEAFIGVIKETEVELVALSVAELGLENGSEYQQICARGLELGYELCPAEVGPRFRLQYPDLLRSEAFTFAMKAIEDSEGELRIFSVGHSRDGQALDGSPGGPDYRWGRDNQFFFVRPKPLLVP
jgi:hypothetical protein